MKGFKEFMNEKYSNPVVVNKKKSGEVSSVKYDVIGLDDKVFKRSVKDPKSAYKEAKRIKSRDIHVELERIEKDESGGRTRYKIRNGKWVAKKNPKFGDVPPCSSLEAFKKLEL